MFVFGKGGGGSGATGGSGVQTVADLTALNALAGSDGDLAVKLDSHELYMYNGSAWQLMDELNGLTDNGSGGAAIQMTNTSNPIQLVSGSGAQSIKLPDATTLSNGKTYLFINNSSGGSITVRDSTNGLLSVILIGRFGFAVLTDNSTAAGTWVFGRITVTASQVGSTATGNLSSTNVDAALQELQGDIDALTAAGALVLDNFGTVPNAKGISSTPGGFHINLEPADATNPGAISTSAQTIPGEKRFPSGVHAGDTGALGANEAFRVTSTTKGSTPAPLMTTLQRDSLGTPTNGLRIFNTDTSQPEFYDGTRWQKEIGLNVATAQTPAAASTPTILGFRRQVLPVSGSGGAVTLADLGVANAEEGDELVIIGTSDTNTVTIVSATNTVLNGDCTLGLDDTLELVFYSSKWREKGRNI